MRVERILQATDPVDLFGEDAVACKRTLRRAYADLIKKFGPDQHPQAFERIRSLYELALNILDGGAAADKEAVTLRFPPADSPPVAAAAASADPSVEETLKQIDALCTRGAMSDAESLFRDFEPVLQRRHPDTWLATIATLLPHRVWYIPAAQLRADLDALDDVDMEADPAVVWRLVELIFAALAWRQARDDPRVPGPLVRLVPRSYVAADGELVPIWLRAIDEMGGAAASSEVLRRVYPYLQTEHPGLCKCLSDIRERVNGQREFYDGWRFRTFDSTSLPHAVLSELDAIRLRIGKCRWPLEGVSLVDEATSPVGVAACIVMMVAGLGTLLCALLPVGGEPMRGGTAAFVYTTALVALTLGAGCLVAAIFRRRCERDRRRLMEALAGTMRRFGLWRHELLAALYDPAPKNPQPIVDYSYAPLGPWDDPLLRFELDPGVLATGWSDAHARRCAGGDGSE